MQDQTQRGLVSSHFLIVTLASAVLCSLWGCGVKSYPRPLTPEQLPPIQDLNAQVRVKAVEVSWTVPEELNQAAIRDGLRFAILKSELPWENRHCLDCPASTTQEVQSIDPIHPEPAFRDGDRFVWTDSVVASNHAYRYQVQVRDRKRHVLLQSNATLAKVVAAPPPLKSLSASTEDRGILLQWVASKPPASPLKSELQFLVERQTVQGNWEKLTPHPIAGNTFLDSNVASGQSYSYRVLPAYVFEDALILGDESVFRHAKAPEALPPTPPATVWVIPVKGALEVHWLKSDGRVGGYHVYRREGKEIIRLTGSPVQGPPYTDRAIARNVIYSYAVSAVSDQAEHREGLLSKWTEIRSLLIDQ